MKLIVSQKSEAPIYEQLYEQIAVATLSGELRPDEALPSIRHVANELGVSVITVKNAYELLERDGYIYTRAGKGSFVAPDNIDGMRDKRAVAASDKLKQAIEYCKSVGLSKQETEQIISDLIKSIFE